MPRGSVTSKVFLGILTLLFWAAAAGLIFVGVWVYMEYRHYEQLGDALYTLIPATIVMALGVFFFILGLVGCVGAFKEQRCMLGVYFTILLVILVGLVVTSALGYVYRTEVDKAVKKGINNGLEKYLNDSVYQTEMDFMQSHLHCCGLKNYRDWANTTWGKVHAHKNERYPASCCKDSKCNYDKHPQNDTALYTEGCYLELKNEFLNHLAIIAGTAATFAVVLMLGMICSCALICRKRDNTPYLGLTSPEHMRV